MLLRTLFVSLLILGCQTHMEEVRLSNTLYPKHDEEVKVDLVSNVIDVKINKARVTGVHCVLKDSDSRVLLLNRDQEVWAEHSCDGPEIQSFARSGLSVVAVNWADGANSSWEFDLGGDRSLEVLSGYLDHFGRPFVGIWAVGQGSILAARLAKNTRFQWALFGDGIYDFEAYKESRLYSSQEQALKLLEASEGDQFLEKRSIAWDFDGFPARVYLYYNSCAEQILQSQAREFKGALSASNVSVSLKAVEVVGCRLSAEDHAYVIESFLSWLSRFNKVN